MTSRQEFIRDVVDHYIKNNQEEYKKTLKIIKEKKGALRNKDLATGKDGIVRQVFTFPPGLWSVLDIAIDDPKFLEQDGEAKWFSKKYPQFLIPEVF